MNPRATAIDFYNQAVRIKPEDPQTAYKLLNSAVSVDPGFPEGWFQLANANTDLKLREAAVAAHRRAIELAAEDHKAWTNLGHQLYFLGRLADARTATRRAIELAPAEPYAWCNLSLIQSVEGQIEKSLESARKAFEMKPTETDLEMGLAFAYLFAGDFARGLKHFEARFPYRLKQFLNLPYPRWAGEDLEGKTLFIIAEQGLGDTLSYTRFIPRVVDRAAKVILQVQPELIRMIGFMLRPWAGKIELRPLPETYPAADYWCSPTSLPVALGLTSAEYVATPGVPVPHAGLGPPPAWKVEGRRLHVGIAWAGSPGNDIDVWRSCDVRLFLDLYKAPGIQLYGLQVGDHAQDIHATGSAALIRDMAPYIRDVADTVQIIRDLDLVITVETSLGHIAGAIDADCWVLNAKMGGDYRIGRRGEGSIWYPRHRMFRQGPDGTWGPVFERVVGALKKRIGI